MGLAAYLADHSDLWDRIVAKHGNSCRPRRDDAMGNVLQRRAPTPASCCCG